MISLEKWLILTLLKKLPNYEGDLGKIIVATGFECLPKAKNAQSGHTSRVRCRQYFQNFSSVVSSQVGFYFGILKQFLVPFLDQ